MVHATLCLATGEELEDHHGKLQDAPKGHLNAFRGRRDEPPEEKTYNQNEFDPAGHLWQRLDPRALAPGAAASQAA